MIDVTFLKENISPAFYSVHDAVVNDRYTHYKLCGGRGSTKSSFISIEIIFGIIRKIVITFLTEMTIPYVQFDIYLGIWLICY